MPESIEVMFTTDPVTGKSEGPFDPASGRRVETHIGDDGILRVVIDPVTGMLKASARQAQGNAGPAMRYTLLLIAAVTTATVPALRHEALAQQPATTLGSSSG